MTIPLLAVTALPPMVTLPLVPMTSVSWHGPGGSVQMKVAVVPTDRAPLLNATVYVVPPETFTTEPDGAETSASVSPLRCANLIPDENVTVPPDTLDTTPVSAAAPVPSCSTCPVENPDADAATTTAVPAPALDESVDDVPVVPGDATAQMLVVACGKSMFCAGPSCSPVAYVTDDPPRYTGCDPMLAMNTLGEPTAAGLYTCTAAALTATPVVWNATSVCQALRRKPGHDDAGPG